MALTTSGTLSMNDIISISSRGSGAEASLGWLGATAGFRTYNSTADISIGKFYGAGNDIVIDFNGTATNIGTQNSKRYYRYQSLVDVGQNSPQVARYKLKVTLSVTDGTIEVKYRVNAPPTDTAYSVLASGTQTAQDYIIPGDIDYNDVLYIAIDSSHSSGASQSWTLVWQDGGTIMNGLISSITASGTTTWTGTG